MINVNRYNVLFVMLLLLSGVGSLQANQEGTAMKVESITAVLPVDRIEPSIAFFEKIGFTTDQAVPEGDHIGFIIVKHGETQLMYQTYSSIEGDVGSLGNIQKGAPTNIYIIVSDIDAIDKALSGYDITIPRRKTFYGAEEIGYREPGGHLVTFAEFGEG